MKTGQQYLFGFLIAIMISVAGATGERDSVAITVYNDNFAVIRDNRSLELKSGLNTLRFTDVAATIDPTSVSFKCLNKPDQVSILEQNYEYDLVNTDSLLKRYIDKRVNIWVKGSGQGNPNQISGILNAAIGSDLIIQNAVSGMIEIVNRDSVERIMLEKRPEDLITRPTLVWLAQSKLAGAQPCQITYTATGMSWKADYTAIISDNEKALDLTGWVTIDNRSGAAYQDAKVKLIAGNVRRISPPIMTRRARTELMMMAEPEAAPAGFEEKAFMDYHMYTLGRASTLNNNQTKQIEFIEPVHDIPVEKRYIYETSIDPWLVRNRENKVKIMFEFDNKETYGLGIALPAGKIRTFKKDPADDALEFVGEDSIDHTPREEKVKLYIGDAFDIVGEQKSVDQKARTGWRQTTREITIKNRKTETVSVCVDEKFMENRTWVISSNNIDYEKIDATTARFTIKTIPDSEHVIKFIVTETW